MKALVIGVAVLGGPAVAWHMRAVARRWPSTHEPLSGPEVPALVSRPARTGHHARKARP